RHNGTPSAWMMTPSPPAQMPFPAWVTPIERYWVNSREHRRATTSKEKAEASRANGQLGGRPRKKTVKGGK
ncbi:MAG: hypothetical protein ABSC05_26585, partial [Candidatus Solibacter sp.]